MSDTKILQAILDGQVQIRKDIKEGANSLDKKIDNVDNKVDKLIERVDKLGLKLAYLEDDPPTRSEHDKLKKRVKTIEQKLASA